MSVTTPSSYFSTSSISSGYFPLREVPFQVPKARFLRLPLTIAPPVSGWPTRALQNSIGKFLNYKILQFTDSGFRTHNTKKFCLPIGLMSKKRTGVWSIALNMRLCRDCEHLTSTSNSTKFLPKPKIMVTAVRPGKITHHKTPVE